MNFLRRIFGGLQPSYLIRSYLIGLIFFALMIGMALNAETKNGSPVGLIVFALAEHVALSVREAGLG